MNNRFKPIERWKIDKAIELRKNGNKSYKEIAEEVGISKESVRRYCDKALPNMRGKVGRPRTKKSKKNVKVNLKVNNKKPKSTYKSTLDYDFLSYIRLVFKWATDNNDLSRPEVELILYLYSKGVFTKREFNKYHMVISMYQGKTFNKLIKEGWIHIWRAKTSKEAALYSLTDKAKTLCSKMHKFCVGDLEIPTNSTNKTFTDKTKRINKYFINAIKDMSKRQKKEI